MKRTPFTHIHEQLGARMTPFAGYNMPLEYSGVIDEHLTVRRGVGVFDVSHMGEFWLRGKKALELAQLVTTNDVAALTPGKIQYSCFPNGKGGIVDDLLVYCFDSENYLMVVNAANIEKDWNWVSSHNTMGATLENASPDIAQLAIQGPLAIQAMQPLTNVNLSELKYYTFVQGEFAGVKDVIISATGYTGAGGFELYMKNADAEKIWKALFDAGQPHGIKPIGLAARDTLRLEAGFCLYGNDIDDTTSPIEAGLGWITKFTSGNNFIDRPVLQAQKDAEPVRRLKGFVMIDKGGIPRHGYEIVDANGNNIGVVTSGTQSPILNQAIGMGYVSKNYMKDGSEIFIKVRNKSLKAKIVKTPFFNLAS